MSLSSLPLLLLLALVGADAGPPQTPGRIFPDPTRPCPGARPHDICFATPQDGVARAEFRSAQFYAVILRTAAPCGISERERLAAQARFPRSKVFALRFGCDDDIENNVSYTNVDERYSFMAVYAGATREQAVSFLRRVQATGHYPGANLRRMQAVLAYT
jgi:hypothetical protein